VSPAADAVCNVVIDVDVVVFEGDDAAAPADVGTFGAGGDVAVPPAREVSEDDIFSSSNYECVCLWVDIG